MDFPMLLKTKAAAARLGISKSSLEKWRLYGGGPPFIKRGRSVYYSIHDLDRWVDSRPRFQSTSEAAASGQI